MRKSSSVPAAARQPLGDRSRAGRGEKGVNVGRGKQGRCEAGPFRCRPVTGKGEPVRELYRRIAARYDLLAHLYYLVGFRGRAYRKMAVRDLNLVRGDTVIDIGCGTGLCFSYLQEKVGPEGRIIGVDLSGDMLEKAWERVQKRGWSNVELVECDAAEFDFPGGVAGVISVFSLRSIERYEALMRKAALTLTPGGRFVVLDLRLPDRSHSWVKRMFLAFAKPFGVGMELAGFRPWEPGEVYFEDTRITPLYFGFAYIFSGRVPTRSDCGR